MINRLILKNFQSWADLELDLTGVNVVVGETNQGKSAIMRALSAVFFNAMEGASFVRKGASKASVTVVMEDGARVSLEKGENVNRYIVDDKVYDKIGRDVPDPVKRALGIERAVFDDDTYLYLQLQSQMDSPFLLTDQGVRATRLLGSVSNVATIYQAAKISSKKRGDSAIQYSTLRAYEVELDAKIAAYDWLDEIAPQIEQIEQDQRALERQVELISMVESSYNSLMASQEDHIKSLYMCQQTETIVTYNQQLLSNLEEQSRLKGLADDMETSQSRVTEISEVMDAMEAEMEVRGKIVKYLERLSVVATERAMLESYLDIKTALYLARSEVANNEDFLFMYSQRYAKLQSEMTCPTCGNIRV